MRGRFSQPVGYLFTVELCEESVGQKKVLQYLPGGLVTGPEKL